MKREAEDIISIVVVCVFVLLLSIAILMLYLNRTAYLQVYDPNSYFSGEYLSYNAGKEAGEFFDEFVDTDGYTNISFIYRDLDGIIRLHSYQTTFVLDIQFDTEKYFELKSSILPSTSNPDPDLLYNYQGNFLITQIILDKGVYNDNYCGVCFDDDYHIIRYIFMHGIGSGFADPESMIGRNVPLNWNQSDNDLVFE